MSYEGVGATANEVVINRLRFRFNDGPWHFSPGDPEGPPNENAKDEAARVLKDAQHKRDKGSDADEATRDDPQKGDEE